MAETDRRQEVSKLVQKYRFRRRRRAVDIGYFDESLSDLQTDELKFECTWPAAGLERFDGQFFVEDERQSATSSTASGVSFRKSMNVEDREVVRRDVILDGIRRIVPNAGLTDRENVESIVANQVVDQRSLVDGTASIPGTEPNVKRSRIRLDSQQQKRDE